MRVVLTILGVLAFSLAFAQAQLQPAQLIRSAKSQNLSFQEKLLFHPAQQDDYVNFRQVETHNTLELDEEELAQLLHEAPGQLSFRLPSSGRIQDLEVELVRVEVMAPGADVVLASKGEAAAVKPALHYRGLIKGDEESVVAVSFFENEAMGLFSSSHLGNLVLGRMEKGDYILYNDHQLLREQEFECATPDEGPAYKPSQLEMPAETRALNDCVGIYLEVDYDIYQNKGGLTGATNYITGLFNQAATLYANENVSINISEIFLWDTGSAYYGTSSYDLLTQFVNRRPNFNGDLGQLLSYKASGGIAYLSGLCNPYSPKHSFSSINTSYAEVPAYSFSVMVVAHELGHLFGSRHTHACAWNGNGTAIDACAGYTEGNCASPPTPAGGGTIMSYCHLSAVGINFTKGFGSQPGNLIRNAVANASCLQPCGDDGSGNGDDDPPTNDECVGQEVSLKAVLDLYGAETTWRLRKGGGEVLFSGGPYQNASSGTVIEESLCLEEGCYVFEIYDSFGDGICCGYGNGSYELRDTSGAILATGGAFGSQDFVDFCLPFVGDEGGSDCMDIDFNELPPASFGGPQDGGYMELMENGQVLKIGNNAWKAIELPYEVTAKTVIEFDFGSTIRGEIHGIGFDDNNSISANRTFRLFGSQNWGLGSFANYPGNASWKHYIIPVGQFYQGRFNYLFFVADHDRNPRNGNSYFRNVRIYEGNGCEGLALPPAGALALMEENAKTPTTGLSIFPNPAGDWLNLELHTPQAGQAYVQALSLTGQLVLEQGMAVLPGTSSESLDVSSLPGGAYILKVRLGQEQIVERFTVVRR